MAKDAFYFKHDANASSDLKLKAVRKKFGWAGCGWFWFIVELMRNEEDYGLGYSDLTFVGLTDDLGIEPEKVKEFIDYCVTVKLFEKNDTHFYSKRLSRDMEVVDALREQRREAGLRSAEKRLSPTTVQQPLNKRSTRREDKKRKEKIKERILPEWIDKETWDAFLEMRKSKKATPTPKAIELIINELEKFKAAGDDPNEMLNRSIMNNWKGVFALEKEAKSGANRQSSRQLTPRESYTRPEDA